MVRECVILAAGEGKRMRPLTTNRPKVMLPVGNKPMLEHLIEAVRDSGIEKIVLVVGYGERSIRDYFHDGECLGVKLHYVVQRRQLGTGDALLSARSFVREDFILLNGDMIISSSDISALSHIEAPAMAVTTSTHPQDFGVVTLDGLYVTGLKEKSEHPESDFINAGAYHLSSGIFTTLTTLGCSPRGEYELTDALTAFISNGSLSSHTLSSWLDIGYPWDLLSANENFLPGLNKEILGEVEDGVVLKGIVRLGEGSVIRSGTYIEGPCIIGKNCIIGPHAFIRGSTAIGNNCHIGHSVELKNSVVMDGTKIPHFNYVGDSVIGKDCNFGAGTKIANLRHDHSEVIICGQRTMRRKMGAIIGDNVLFGINCSVNVGAVIGSNVRISPHSYVEGWIEEGSVVL